MNKKGFVFMETLVVLIVLVLGIVSLYSIYINLSSNIERRKHYDNVSDLYKTDLIRSNFTNTDFDGNNVLIINSSNCETYMKEDCSSLLIGLNVNNIYINLTTTKNLYNSNNTFSNSLKEYLKTMYSENYTRYIIVNYVYDGINYYASLLI